MGRDWSDERYVRLYTRDTATWKLVGWQARTVLLHLLRKVDRAGVLEVGEDGEIGLAAVLELPEEIIATGIAALIRRGTVVATSSAYILPNFIEAQEARTNDRQRQRDLRERRRASAIDGPVTVRDEVSRSVTERHAESHGVTRCHTASHAVTPSLAVPSRAELSRERETPASPAPLSLVPPEPQAVDPAVVLWDRQNRHRTTAGLRQLKLTATARRAVAARLKEYSVDDLAAVVDEDAASARQSGDWQWFNGETNWRAANVARTYGRIGTARPGSAPSSSNGSRPVTGVAAGLEAVRRLEAKERERAARVAEEGASWDSTTII